jgi:hypothetical protein
MISDALYLAGFYTVRLYTITFYMAVFYTATKFSTVTFYMVFIFTVQNLYGLKMCTAKFFTVLPGLEAASQPIEQKSTTIWRKLTTI